MTGHSPRRPVVVGLDGSDSARAALDFALKEAERRNLPLRILHAWTVPMPPVAMGGSVPGPDEAALEHAARILVDEAVAYAAEAHPSVEVTAELRTAPAATALLTAAGEDAFMVVVGSRGLGSFSELFVGSVGVQVATHSPVPVVIVHTPAAGVVPGPDAGRVVVGVDGSELSDHAVHVAFEEASLRGVGLTVLHAWYVAYFDAPGTAIPPSLAFDEVENDELRALAETVAGLREKYPDVSLEQRLVHGQPKQVVVEASRGAELVVLGSRGMGGFRSLLLGSVSHYVVHHCHAPVMIVRPTEA